MDELKRYTNFAIDGIDPLPGGRIKLKAALTKTGVFEYLLGDKTIREKRSDDEVFSADSLSTLEGAYVTVDHPNVDPKLVAVGRVLKVEADPPYVRGELQVEDDRTASMIKNGHLKELSCGYFMKLEAADGLEADFIQTQIRYDHAAIGPEGWGRLGRDVCLRLDSNRNEEPTHFIGQNNMSDKKEAETVQAQAADSADKLDLILNLLKSFGEKIEQRQDAEPKVEPVTETREELPSIETLDKEVERRADAKTELELRARDAYSAIFPKDYIKPKRCGRKLCEDVIQHVDRDFRATNESDADLVSRAELIAKKARIDDAKPTISELQKTFMTGTPPLRQQASLRDRLLNQ